MTTFIPNPDFWDELNNEPEAQQLLADAATACADMARQIAQDFRRSGDYIDSIFADGNRYGSTIFYAHWIEWGSVNNPPHAPLRRAAEALGYRYVDVPASTLGGPTGHEAEPET